MKRRILLVDDEVAVLLTLKAVLEISGFDVDTATSAREGKSRIKHREYEMIITDMRMEEEEAGLEVIAAAREASYAPAVALLTAFPVDDDSVNSLGADKMLVKPMHTRVLLQQLESLFTRHVAAKEKATVKKTAAKKPVASKTVAKKAVARQPEQPAQTSVKGVTGSRKSVVAAAPVGKTAASAKAKTPPVAGKKTLAAPAKKSVAKGKSA